MSATDPIKRVGQPLTYEEASRRVDEMREAQNEPNVVSEKSETGRGPEKPGVSCAGKVDTGVVDAKNVRYSLADLAKDYYLFSTAPISFIRNRGVRVNFFQSFANRLRLTSKDAVRPITCGLPSPFLATGNQQADFSVSGLTFGGGWTQEAGMRLSCTDNYGELFKKYLDGCVIVDANANPKQYWWIYRRRLKYFDPSSPRPVEIDVFLPSGSTARIDVHAAVDGTSLQPDGAFPLVRAAPDPTVVIAATQYFSAGGLT